MCSTGLANGTRRLRRCRVSRILLKLQLADEIYSKSQLAIEYLYRIRDLSPTTRVFWVHASNAARFEQSYHDIADCVDIPERNVPGANVLQLVHNWLRDERNGKWVITIDNMDNADFLVEACSHSQEHQTQAKNTRPLISYLPHSPNGSILITSRSQEVALKLVEPCNAITIDPMSEADALTLLDRKLGEHNDGSRAIELAGAMEFMPLALVQAAAYIRLRALRCSVRQYLEEFHKSDQKSATLLSDFEGGQPRRDFEARNSIIRTWHLSFDHIQQIQPSAADLLALMSFFDRQGIPETLLDRQYEGRARTTQNKEDESGDCIENTEADHASSGRYVTLEDDITTLRSWAFISLTPDGRSFEMHRLVQLATQRWLRTHGQHERWKQQSIRVLNTEFSGDHFENLRNCQPLYPHVKSVATQKPESDQWLLRWASLLHQAARHAQIMTNWLDAEKMSLQSIQAREKVLKPGHPDIRHSMALLAGAYSHQGR